MAKKAEQNRLQDKNGLTVEKNTLYDDSLLPSADELSKLNSISDKIVPWIMKRTEIEQDARLKFNEDQVEMAKSDMKIRHRHSFMALLFAFIIVMSFLYFSFYLVKSGHTTEGTVFAGATIVLIVSYFLKRGESNK